MKVSKAVELHTDRTNFPHERDRKDCGANDLTIERRKYQVGTVFTVFRRKPNKNGALIEMNHCLFLRRVEHAFALHFREFNAISRKSNALKLSPPYLSHLS